MRTIPLLLIATFVIALVTRVPPANAQECTPPVRAVTYNAYSPQWVGGDIKAGTGIGDVRRGSNLTLNLERASDEVITRIEIHGSYVSTGATSLTRTVGAHVVTVHPAQINHMTQNLIPPQEAETVEYVGVGGESGNIFIAWVRVYYRGACLQASFTASPQTGAAELVVEIDDTSTGGPETWVWDMGDGNTYEGYQDLVYPYSQPGTYIVTLTVTKGEDSSEATQTIYVSDPESGGGGAAWYQPVRATERNTWGMFDYRTTYETNPDLYQILIDALDDGLQLTPGEAFSLIGETVNVYNDLHFMDSDPNTVLSFSINYGASVHAITSGKVISVEKIDCDARIALALFVYRGGNHGECYLKVPATATGDTHHIYRLDQRNLYKVRVQTDPITAIEYIVANPSAGYGDTITEGCIIGETVAMYNWIGLELDNLFISGGLDSGGGGGIGGGATFERVDEPIATGVTFTTHAGLTNISDLFPFPPSVPVLDMLQLDPANLTPCNADPQYAACLTNAELNDPAQWDTFGGVVWDVGNKPTLQPGGGISTTLYLAEDIAYSLTAQVHRIGFAGSIGLRLGETNTTYDLDTETGTYIIPADIHAADSGLVHTVQLINTGATPIEVMSLCVAEGQPDLAPATCYFRNPSFNDGLSGWTATEDVTLGLTTGEIIMPDESTIAQPAKLYPNGAQSYEYAVTIRATVFGAGWASETSSTVAFEWEYPTGNGWDDFLSPASTATYSFASFQSSYPNNITFFPGNEVVFQALVPVDAVTESAFTIRSQIDLQGEFQGGVLVREVCVNDPFAHWPEASGGVSLPFEVSCARVSPPTDGSVGSWTYFLWSSLDRFFQCDLMTLLNRIFNVGYETLRTIRWSILYGQSLVVYGSNWLGRDLLPWLAGYLSNAALSAGVDTGDTGANFWDFLISLITGLIAPLVDLFIDVVWAAFGLLIDIITRIVDLVFLILEFLVTRIFALIGMVTALVTAWNTATPADISWLPNCATDPKSHAFCIVSWVIENSILSVTPGQLLIPLIISIMSIDMVLEIIGDISRAIRHSAEVA